MFSFNNIKAQLEKSEMPVCYRGVPSTESVSLPFVVYYCTGSDNFVADGKTYFKVNEINVELYTINKDLDAEAKLEEVLDFAPWGKIETYIESEKCYQIIYTMEV